MKSRVTHVSRKLFAYRETIWDCILSSAIKNSLFVMLCHVLTILMHSTWFKMNQIFTLNCSNCIVTWFCYVTCSARSGKLRFESEFQGRNCLLVHLLTHSTNLWVPSRYLSIVVVLGIKDIKAYSTDLVEHNSHIASKWYLVSNKS